MQCSCLMVPLSVLSTPVTGLAAGTSDEQLQEYGLMFLSEDEAGDEGIDNVGELRSNRSHALGSSPEPTRVLDDFSPRTRSAGGGLKSLVSPFRNLTGREQQGGGGGVSNSMHNHTTSSSSSSMVPEPWRSSSGTMIVAQPASPAGSLIASLKNLASGRSKSSSYVDATKQPSPATTRSVGTLLLVFIF